MKLTGVVVFCPTGPGGQLVKVSLDPPGCGRVFEFFILGGSGEDFDRGDGVAIKVKKT